MSTLRRCGSVSADPMEIDLMQTPLIESLAIMCSPLSAPAATASSHYCVMPTKDAKRYPAMIETQTEAEEPLVFDDTLMFYV